MLTSAIFEPVRRRPGLPPQCSQGMDAQQRSVAAAFAVSSAGVLALGRGITPCPCAPLLAHHAIRGPHCLRAPTQGGRAPEGAWQVRA
jgi:hypothetical protein